MRCGSGGAACGFERDVVDDVAAIAGQFHAADRLGIGRTRLGVLPGKAPHPDHRRAQAVHQHQAHLQQHLEPVGNRARLAVAEVLRAITALQQEGHTIVLTAGPDKKEMAMSALKEKLSERFIKRYATILQYESNILNELFKVLNDISLRDFKKGCPLANIVQEMSNLDEDFDAMSKGFYEDLKKCLIR